MNGRHDSTTINMRNSGVVRRACVFINYLMFFFVYILILDVVLSGSGSQVLLGDERPDSTGKTSLKAFLAKGLHSIDVEEDSYSAPPLKPIRNSPPQIKEQATPLALPKTNSRPYFAPTPARKMTVRRDPRKDRYVGNGVESGQSLLSIQNGLQYQQRHNSFEDMQITQVADYCGKAGELPYGKYIYVHHGPLLFEDIPLERYGEEFHPCLQPVISFTKFMGTVPMVPYKITADCSAAKHYGALSAVDQQGNLRPGILEGQYFPSYHIMQQYPRANVAAALVEAGSVAGIVLFIP